MSLVAAKLFCKTLSMEIDEIQREDAIVSTALYHHRLLGPGEEMDEWFLYLARLLKWNPESHEDPPPFPVVPTLKRAAMN